MISLSLLQTTLIDEATGHAKYKIDASVKITRSVARIRKLDSPPQSPFLPLPAIPSSGSDPASSSQWKSDSEKGKKDKEGSEAETELPEANDEIVRVYWKWFLPVRIIFRGRIFTRNKFLQTTGKMKGQVDSPSFPFGTGLNWLQTPGASCSPDRTAFSTDGRWAPRE